MRTIRLPFKLAATTAMAMLAGTAVFADTHAMAKKGGELTVAIETDVRGFDTVAGGVLGQTGEIVMRTIQEPLLDYDGETNEVKPLLATEWSASEDQKVWTFKLREGVKFHDGSDFDAGDVAAHYNRILDPAMKSRSRTFIASIEKVVAVDPLTVEFHLAHPWQALLPYLATTSMSGPIPPKEAVEADTQNRSPVGTGPFRFVDWASGDRITVERNPDYWAADEINLDKITFRILPDTQTRFASLRSGEVDVMWTDRGPSIIEAKTDSKLVALESEGAGAAVNLLNGKKEPLSNANLRKALAHAWNQDALVKISWQNTRPAVTHPLGPVKDCGDANYRGFDVAKAKEYVQAYLDETGKTEVPTIVMIHTTTPRGRELGEIYQQTAKAAGIPLELQPVDQSTLVKRVFTNDFDISGWRIADGADMGPQLFAYAMPGSSYNLTGFDNPELTEISQKMRVALTMEERLDLQCQMVSLMNDDGGILYRGGGRYHAFTTPRVKGVPAPYRGVVDVTRAWIDEQS
ncbi:ABC transporter substrate-binding protein [Pseudooceanicola onchidii]|uniref:ABC transporter substrate-binding protein n=1 Tax=Pseudooceanicola onchidii TaxID=2562279 RepID=UPI0010AA5E35|nr:ABC transporter substrate-binding protein [Pseudooceanicola onchidii]